MLIRDSKPLWGPLFLAAVACVAWSGIATAQTATWTGANGPNWLNPANWSGTDPVNNSTRDLVFGEVGAQNTNNNNNLTNFTANSITFNGSPTIYALNGNGISLGGNISNTGGSNTINLNLALTGNRTIDVTGGNLTINGVISGGAFNLIKTGGTDLLLTGANTYNGDTIINGGVLNVTSLADGGVASSIGDSGVGAANLVLDGGTLRYVGSSPASTNRLFSLGATGTINSDGSGRVNFTSTDSIALAGAAGARQLTLTGSNTANNILAPTIVGANTSVVKSGSGTWVLTGANTYGGGTTVSNGILQVNNTAGSGTGINAVIVTGSGILRGSGTIGGNVLVNAGGEIRAGTSGASPANTLAIQDSLQVNAGGTLGVRLRTATASSTPGGSTTGPTLNPTSNTFLNVSGGVTFQAGSLFEVDGTGLTLNPNQSYSYRIAQTGTDQSGLSITDQARFTATGFDGSDFVFSVTGNAAGAIFLNFAPVPVPEPAAVLGVAAAALLAGATLRRRLRGEPAAGG